MYTCRTEEFAAAREIVFALRKGGFQAMLVGGAVRDLVMGRTPHDFDIVSTARPEALERLFPEVRLVGRSFGVALVRSGGFWFEVAAARQERFYMDGRHPEQVQYTDDLSQDVLRRDFTVNALLLDPETGELKDFVGGLADLRAGVIRTVGDPQERFQEDYLRMLRAVRFAARFGYELEPGTRRSMEKLAPLAAELSGERIHQELERMLLQPHPDRAFQLLAETGLLKAVLPEADALRGVEQPPQYHPEGDVFTHTMLMLRHMAFPDPVTAWSALLHDIGKPGTFFRNPEEGGRIRFFDHESKGADMAFALLNRLHFSVDQRDAIVQAVRNHMRFAFVREMRKSKLRRLLGDPNFSAELELHRLDCLSSHAFLEGFVFLLDALRQNENATVLPEPLVRGRDLIAAGFPPSPVFGKVLEQLYDRQLAGEITGKDAALSLARSLYASAKSQQER